MKVTTSPDATPYVIIIAQEEERPLVNLPGEVIITGVGAINVYQTLKDLDRKTPIISIGYAGSNSIPIGEKVHIGKVALRHPIAKYDEPEFHLGGNIPCFTAGDFVTSTEITEPCVFDMELAYILAMDFENVTAYKVVSDNLNKAEYDKTVKS